ncbi:helix-turn-helix transcriptional regulator [Streptomyces aquilus]|uniref:helix-turn-helix transcriptional regulator n=1 Tax=Streptomyces aquilus TaxID=2548456 RepID=UPI0037D4B155
MSSPPSEDTPTHLTVKQLAERWHTTPRAIYIARHRGRAPKGFKRGKNRAAPVLFPLAEVEAFEAKQLAEDVPSQRGTTAEHRPAEPLLPRRVPSQRTHPSASQ